MIFSIIQKSQLGRADRIDSEFYQPEYLEIVSKVSKIPHDTLENISESLLSFGAYSLTSFIQWKESGIPFITAEDVKEGFINLENPRFIDEKVDEILKKSRVHENEVLLAMSGKVGDAAVAVDIPSRLNSNQDIVKIKLKKEYSPYFLAVFLNSKFGRLQVLRLPVGSVQQHIFLWQTKSLLIPNFSKEFVVRIENLYKFGLKEIKNSKTFYQQAEELLLEELGLKNAVFEDDLSYVVNFSGVQKSDRVDSDFFQPKYEELISILKKNNAKFFIEVIENVPARFNPKLDEQYKYVELANINSSIGVIDGYEEVLGKEAPSRAKRILKEDDVIVSSVEGSLDKVALVAESQNGYLASTGFFQFRSKEILPEVLLTLAKSIIFQMQLKKHCTGTILTAVPNEALKQMYVPVLPKTSQAKIAELVRKSHEARKKSKELLEEAKRKVEEMIDSASSLQVEKGGKN
ncbi:MAG: hypothetical protein M1405_00475 [Patescibacteria group bacterium]|nr:hypothetical protein [Patescibacteria group bacterium]